MALPLWGNLQKAQDDAETIEQAIERLIAEHEQSPTAHLGEGESLQQHKDSTVLDHLEGSVVIDKMTNREKLFLYTCSQYESWTQRGTISIWYGFPGISAQATTTNRRSGAYRAVNNGLYSNRDFMMQFTAYVDTGFANAQVRMGLSEGSLNYGDGVYFALTYSGGWQLKAVVETVDNTYESDVISHDVSEQSVYRIRFDAYLNTITFTIDEVVYWVFEWPDRSEMDNLEATYYADFWFYNNNSTGTLYGEVRNLIYSESVKPTYTP